MSFQTFVKISAGLIVVISVAGALALLGLLTMGAIYLAAWAASDEPYMKVAPFKPCDMKTKLSIESLNGIRQSARAHEELRRERL